MKLLVTLLLCGLGLTDGKAADSRIVNGEEATYGEHPYICSLQAYNPWYNTWGHICGSVIWNNYYIVTAAHCVVPHSGTSYRVQCGNHVMNNMDSHEIALAVNRIYPHPYYSESGGYPNDIALLELQYPGLSFNDKVHAYPLAGRDSGDFAGQTCTLSGWGKTEYENSPNILRKVNMKAISINECAALWRPLSGNVINRGHLCFHEPVKSACSGDSGGPVRCGNVIAGVTSWGISSCNGQYPSVYTRLSYFYDWLSGIAGAQAA